MAWLGYQLNDGPVKSTDKALRYTGSVRGTARRSLFFLWRH